MAKQDALSIYLSDGETEDKLIESYAEVVDMVQKRAISTQIKNQNLSGDPASGSVEVRRLETSVSQAYGTARTAGAGDAVKNNGVTINLNQDKEIVEEIEWKDIQMYGIDGMLAKRQKNHELAMVRELDTAFFTEAEAEGTEVTPTGESIVEKVEDLIVELETVENDNVDGVDRDMIVLTVRPEVYADLRNYIDTLPNPVEGGVDVNTFHGVRIFSNNRQTQEAIAMVEGAIAQPVTIQPYEAERVPLSNAIAVELFYSFGTEAVMPDLIMYADFDVISA
jgi:hypothetical protein